MSVLSSSENHADAQLPEVGLRVCNAHPSGKVSFCLAGTKGCETGFRALLFPEGVDTCEGSESWLLLPVLPFPGVVVSGVGGQSAPAKTAPAHSP